MIFLVDDDMAVTSACQFLLSGMGYAAQSWNSSAQFLAEAQLQQEGVVLLDMSMPSPDGHETFRIMRQRETTLAVVFLTGHGDIQMAVREVRRGAVDFLQKPVSNNPLKTAIERGYHCSRQLNELLIVKQRYQLLTVKEKQIAECVMAGAINKDIADQLYISVRTVEVHRAKVMEKMAATSLAGLVSDLNRIKG